MPPNNQQVYSQQPMQPGMQPGAPVYVDPNQQFQPPVPMGSVTTQPGKPQNNQVPPERKVNSTQNSLLMSELRDSMMIMADGSFRAVIACKSINFDLMSSREREGVEFSYQNFLNALYFPIQIFIRSQRVDIGPYLDKLEALRRQQDNMLLNVLMDDYIQFVDVLSQEANIMDKSFFIVVPYYPNGDLGNIVEQSKGFFSQIFGGGKNKQANGVTRIDKVTYNKAKDEIRNRVDSVMNGLAQVGVSTTQLNTKALGELYYNVYNPDTAVREPLGDFNSITSMYVRKGGVPATPGQGGPM